MLNRKKHSRLCVSCRMGKIRVHQSENSDAHEGFLRRIRIFSAMRRNFHCDASEISVCRRYWFSIIYVLMKNVPCDIRLATCRDDAACSG